MFCCGCSINGYGIPGFSERSIYTSPKIKVITIKSKGFNFFTEGSFGMQLGYIERQLIFPVITKNIDLCIDSLLNNSQDGNINIQQSAEYLDRPVHIDTQWQGGGLDFSLTGIAISFGMGNKQATHIFSDNSFSIYYNNSIKQTEYCSAIKTNDKKW